MLVSRLRAPRGPDPNDVGRHFLQHLAAAKALGRSTLIGVGPLDLGRAISLSRLGQFQVQYGLAAKLIRNTY